jgi:hypothetical protein
MRETPCPEFVELGFWSHAPHVAGRYVPASRLRDLTGTLEPWSNSYTTSLDVTPHQSSTRSG